MPSATSVTSVNINNYLVEEARLSTKRLDRILKVDLNTVEYDESEKVIEARKAFTKMGGLDWACDCFFDGSRKEKAMNLLADKVLGEKAREWQDRNRLPDGSLPAYAPEVSEASPAKTQKALEELITDAGWLAIYSGTLEDTGNGVRLTPSIGFEAGNTMLSMVFSYEFAHDTFKRLGWGDRRLQVVGMIETAKHKKELMTTIPATGGELASLSHSSEVSTEEFPPHTKTVAERRRAAYDQEVHATRDTMSDSVSTKAAVPRETPAERLEKLAKQKVALNMGLVPSHYASQAKLYPAAVNALLGSPNLSDEDNVTLQDLEYRNALGRMVV